MNEKYQGWTNYETWNYALWLDNQQGTSEYWNEQAQDCMRAARMYHADHLTVKEDASTKLADQLKDDAEEFASEQMRSQFNWLADAVNAYLGEVNWFEIAEHFLEDAEEENQ